MDVNKKCTECKKLCVDFEKGKEKIICFICETGLANTEGLEPEELEQWKCDFVLCTACGWKRLELSRTRTVGRPRRASCQL